MQKMELTLPDEASRVFKMNYYKKPNSGYMFDFDSFFYKHFTFNPPKIISAKEGDDQSQKAFLFDQSDFQTIRSLITSPEGTAPIRLDTIIKNLPDNILNQQFNQKAQNSDKHLYSFNPDPKSNFIEDVETLQFNEDVNICKSSFMKGESDVPQIEDEYYQECYQQKYEHDLTNPPKENSMKRAINPELLYDNDKKRSGKKGFKSNFGDFSSNNKDSHGGKGFKKSHKPKKEHQNFKRLKSK